MRGIRRIGIGTGIVIIILLAVFGLAQQKYLVPVLMYHSVAPSVEPGGLLTVSVDSFERQMRFLREHRTPVTLEAAAASILAKSRTMGAVAVTFDDGYEDNYLYAFPILQKYRIPATVFLITSWVDKKGYLTWEEVRRMRDSGLVTFGSHTVNHEPLTKLPPEESGREIVQSKKLLEEKLGGTVRTFCYPLGNMNAAVRAQVIDAGYALAVGTNPGKRWPDNDVFAIKRLRISENARSLLVFGMETSGYYNFFKRGSKR